MNYAMKYIKFSHIKTAYIFSFRSIYQKSPLANRAIENPILFKT
jgi:hypothetical protein